MHSAASCLIDYYRYGYVIFLLMSGNGVMRFMRFQRSAYRMIPMDLLLAFGVLQSRECD
jgi:hypothetical protein